jgi:uncharacterized damage-inducible protein DinB
MEEIICASVYQLQQLAGCIRLFSPEEYARPLEAFSGSSVGMHLRHVIEFYEHLLAAADSGRQAIDYDARERQASVERLPKAALEAVERLAQRLPAHESDCLLTLRASCGGAPAYLRTSLSRELFYNVEHCIHHLAIVKVGMLVHFPEKRLPADFGMAYSTQQHRQHTAQSLKSA